MLVHIDKNRKVLWCNHNISKEDATKHFTDDTIWVAEDIPSAELKEGLKPLLCVDELHHFFYQYEKEDIIYTETQIIMQAIADLELMLLERGMENA